MCRLIKKFVFLLFITLCSARLYESSFAATVAGQEMRTQVMILTDIITDDSRMNDSLTRAEFARMVVKASPYKDSIGDGSITASFVDVPLDNVYAPYIKEATKDGYISAYLGGLYKPDDFVTYKELTRACLALLGYTNDDFKGNQIVGRLKTFSSLKLDENIEKTQNDVITKKDAVNAIYNTLKTSKKGGSVYGPSVFPKMSINSDGGLNASGLIKTKLEGPFILKRGQAFNLMIPFSLEGANIFVNGTSANYDEITRELNHTGYVIYYYNVTTKTIYVYKEGITHESTTLVKKGTITHIYYNASDTVTPTSVEIDLARYNIGNSDMKFAFSYAGTLHVGDQIIFVYKKAENMTSEDEEELIGDIQTVGTITQAYIYDLAY